MRRPARPPAARDYAAMTRATASFSMPAGSGQRHDPPAAGGRRERDQHTRHGRRAPPIVHRGSSVRRGLLHGRFMAVLERREDPGRSHFHARAGSEPQMRNVLCRNLRIYRVPDTRRGGVLLLDRPERM